MKKLFLALAAMAFLFTSCLENEMVSTSSLISAEASATIVAPADDIQSVIITAVVVELAHDPISSVVLEWSRNDTVQAPITMSAGAPEAGNGFFTYTYTHTIPGQYEGTVVTWRVVVTNANGETLQSTEGRTEWVGSGIATIAAWNYEPTNFALQSINANSGVLMANAKLEFFYADGTQATLGHATRASVNVPNNAGGWFPVGAPETINVETSAGWVVTLSTIGYEDITFSADQSSSNNGPRDFRLAYRLGASGTWTEFPGTGAVEVLGDAGEMGQTFTSVSLPATVNNRAEVQIKVWISSNARRSDGALTLDATGGNTSINNIVFIGFEL